jgi:hypothetical protein
MPLQNISIQYGNPLWKSPRRGYIGILTDVADSYTDTVDVKGGYISASMTINEKPDAINDWIEHGIGRHIECHNPSNIERWRGFVNEVVISLGGISFTRGPLINIINKANVKYTDFTTGAPATTGYGSDTTSQAKYGIWTKIVDSGRMSSTNATKIRDTLLAENAYPASPPSFSRTSNLSLTLNCLGYWSMMNFPYNNIVSALNTYTLREKLIDLIEAEPNGVISRNTFYLTTNGLSVGECEDKSRPANEIIKELVALGAETTNDRMIFGVYENGICYYQQVPARVEYRHQLSDPGISIKTTTGKDVEPYDVKPGKYLEFTDFLPGLSTPADIRQDLRTMFIETVTFTAPDDLQLAGAKSETLPQRLAKLGLGGI